MTSIDVWRISTNQWLNAIDYKGFLTKIEFNKDLLCLVQKLIRPSLTLTVKWTFCWQQLQLHGCYENSENLDLFVI